MKKIDYLPWIVSGVCLVGSLAFPAYSTVIRVVGIGSLMPLLWSELRKPVNYASLKFNDAGFAFQKSASFDVTAKWSEVKEVFYC